MSRFTSHFTAGPGSYGGRAFRSLALACATLLGGSLLLVILPGCSELSPEADEAVLLAGPASGPQFIVREGESIQAAVDAAGAGATIHIMPGLYQQGVVVTQPGVRIMGRPGPRGQRVIIENPGGINHGINVRPGADGFALAHVAVRGFDRNGVFIFGVDGFDVRHVTAEDNGVYGIYPIFSRNGSVSHSVASGHADAGFYVGQSVNVRFNHCEAFDNVIGLEISNSIDVEATHNRAYNNSVGFLVALLPGRTELQVAHDIVVRHNVITNNNLPNFAPPGLAAFVPAGSGMLVLGVDDTVVEQNTVTGNDFVGIGVGSMVTFAALAGLEPEAIADIEPHPDRVVVRKNTVTGNGGNPPSLAIPLPGVDLLWDGFGSDICFRQNTYGTSFPAELPECPPA